MKKNSYLYLTILCVLLTIFIYCFPDEKEDIIIIVDLKKMEKSLESRLDIKNEDTITKLELYKLLYNDKEDTLTALELYKLRYNNKDTLIIKPNENHTTNKRKLDDNFGKELLEVIKKKAEPSTIAGTAYLSFKTLNQLKPKYVKGFLKAHGINSKYIDGISNKKLKRSIKKLKGGRGLLVGTMIAAGYATIADETENDPFNKRTIIIILLLLTGIFLWQYLFSIEVVE